jgi:hypothetical protein
MCGRCGHPVPGACRNCGQSFWTVGHEWSALEVAQLAGISPRTAQHWRKTGVIGPTGRYPQLYSHPTTYYTFADVVAHKVLDDLLKAGLPRTFAIGVAEDVACWASRWMADPFNPEDRTWDTAEEWARDGWTILPLTEAARDTQERRVSDESTVMSYDEMQDSIPTPNELEARLKPGKWVVPIDESFVAYAFRLAIEDVAGRVDVYRRDHPKARPDRAWSPYDMWE